MKERLTILAILFSVVLNIVFVGTYIYHKFSESHNTSHDLSVNHRFLYEELNLSSEQLEKFKPVRDRFHTSLREQELAIKDRQLELIDLLDRENPDHMAINTKQIEIKDLQGQLQEKVIDHFLEEDKIFTSVQRAKFFALIKERIAKSDLTRPGWMPRAPANSAEGTR
jgi:Spy/CpxP family protein refolding chaperone